MSTTPDTQYRPKRHTAAGRTVAYHAARSIVRGKAAGCTVLRAHADGSRTALPPCLELRSVSDRGFNWGYQGDRPAQLALAILVEHAGPETALRCYRAFAAEVVARLRGNTWVLTADRVGQWLAGKGVGA